MAAAKLDPGLFVGWVGCIRGTIVYLIQASIRHELDSLIILTVQPAFPSATPSTTADHSELVS
jgi:hypothetical protein